VPRHAAVPCAWWQRSNRAECGAALGALSAWCRPTMPTLFMARRCWTCSMHTPATRQAADSPERLFAFAPAGRTRRQAHSLYVCWPLTATCRWAGQLHRRLFHLRLPAAGECARPGSGGLTPRARRGPSPVGRGWSSWRAANALASSPWRCCQATARRWACTSAAALRPYALDAAMGQAQFLQKWL
jgi:hypothetical protein